MQILRKTEMKALEKAKQLGQDGIIDLLEEKNLLGRGGAAFPTAKKWSIAKNTKADEKYIICNADEGEPGTFKDKYIIKNNAETMIEGMLIAAYVLEAKKCFVYLRGEYEYLRKELEQKIKDVVERSGMDVSIEIVRGAGAYICGEETALIQSIMGNRGHGMYKPPYPPVEGLWGKPTIVNNVETLACAAQAILFDDWDSNLRLFSISGNVSKPGVYELPLGIKMSEIINIIEPKNKLKAISFGCFGGIMPVDENMGITTEEISKQGCSHGSYTIIFIDETNNMVDIVIDIAKFFCYESCGKCTPCREGTAKLLQLLNGVKDGKASEEDLAVIKELAEHVNHTALCGLGQSAGNHIITSLRHFSDDYKK